MHDPDARPASTQPPTRKFGRLGRPSPALVISVIALFFAISGFGIAAKNEITGKDIKDGSITAKDIAKGAIKARHLAKQSVKADAIAKDAVKGRHLSQGWTLCPDGTIVFGASQCPPPPHRFARATDVELTQSIAGQTTTCYYEEVAFEQVSLYPDFRDPYGPTGQIQVDHKASYQVTLTGAWEEGGGTMRALSVSRHIGTGPNAGQHYIIEQAVNPPVEGEETTQSLTFTVPLERWDRLSVQAASCGENVKLRRLTMAVERKYD